ncbi:hypothetical protein L7F22_023878 [Adiantum nelumboides]|nr:hypothetical protein [Adiantum nelumboides]
MLEVAESNLCRGVVVSKEQAYTLLQTCTKQEQHQRRYIRRVHSLIVFAGLDFVEVLCNHLIRLFASSGSLFEAALLFNTVFRPSAHTWSSILSAHVALGQPQAAIRVYFEALLPGFVRNKCIALAALKVCASSISFILHGMLIHHVLVSDGVLSGDVNVQNALIHFYATCGGHDLADALYLFAALQHKNVITWNAVLSGYSKAGNMQLAMQWLEEMLISGVHPNVVSWGAVISGHSQINQGMEALQCFQRMEHEGIVPDRVIYLSALKACGCTGTLVPGRLLHDQIVKSSQEFDVELGTAVVDMYVKCGSLKESLNTFLKLPVREAGPWNALLSGYAQYGNLELALQGIKTMRQGGVSPDVVTLTTLIGAFVLHGDAFFALDLFKNVQGGIRPNAHTFSCVLTACASMGALKDGRGIHDHILRSGIQNSVVNNALVNMYAKCDSLEESHKFLTQLPYRNVVSWGADIPIGVILSLLSTVLIIC